mgnify:CR=1 FL=1
MTEVLGLQQDVIAMPRSISTANLNLSWQNGVPDRLESLSDERRADGFSRVPTAKGDQTSPEL